MDSKYFTANLPSGVRIAYAEEPAKGTQAGVILLIHGFPQTSYQFRKVMKPLASSGYRVIAPDYRGAGLSSKPASGFTKSAMAGDIVQLLDHLSIDEPVHIVGHDVGGMIAYAFASRHPDRTASICWGECPLPGTVAHDESRTMQAVEYFHFILHCQPDIAVSLVSGKEKVYLSHFYDKLAYHRSAISETDLDLYTSYYQREGALRCAFKTYEMFVQDAEENRQWIAQHGKCKLKTLGLSGDNSILKEVAHDMLAEVHEGGCFSTAEVPQSGHYVAEENPDKFVEIILDFIRDA